MDGGFMTFLDFTGSVDVTQVSLALFSGAFAIVVAWVAFRGRAEDAFVQQTTALVEGQATRVAALEGRLDTVEGRLSATQFSLRLEINQTSTLVQALSLAVSYLEKVDELHCKDHKTKYPTFPRLDELRELVDRFSERNLDDLLRDN